MKIRVNSNSLLYNFFFFLFLPFGEVGDFNDLFTKNSIFNRQMDDSSIVLPAVPVLTVFLVLKVHVLKHSVEFRTNEDVIVK